MHFRGACPVGVRGGAHAEGADQKSGDTGENAFGMRGPWHGSFCRSRFKALPVWSVFYYGQSLTNHSAHCSVNSVAAHSHVYNKNIESEGRLGESLGRANPTGAG
jgi:hypothetical protein